MGRFLLTFPLGGCRYKNVDDAPENRTTFSRLPSPNIDGPVFAGVASDLDFRNVLKTRTLSGKINLFFFPPNEKKGIWRCDGQVDNKYIFEFADVGSAVPPPRPVPLPTCLAANRHTHKDRRLHCPRSRPSGIDPLTCIAFYAAVREHAACATLWAASGAYVYCVRVHVCARRRSFSTIILLKITTRAPPWRTSSGAQQTDGRRFGRRRMVGPWHGQCSKWIIFCTGPVFSHTIDT